ncbi:MAG: ammonium transporter, Amt family, partial [Actinomycetota bacterium]|nr:ammonium transporter, Amt family [Actinomycetota bacterium]
NGTGLDSTEGVTGLFYGDVGQLIAQLIACVVISTVIFGIAYTFFKVQNALTKGGIRPSAEDELQGLDMPEMGVLAYPEFGPEVLNLDQELEEAVPQTVGATMAPPD